MSDKTLSGMHCSFHVLFGVCHVRVLCVTSLRKCIGMSMSEQPKIICEGCGEGKQGDMVVVSLLEINHMPTTYNSSSHLITWFVDMVENQIKS